MDFLGNLREYLDEANAKIDRQSEVIGRLVEALENNVNCGCIECKERGRSALAFAEEGKK